MSSTGAAPPLTVRWMPAMKHFRMSWSKRFLIWLLAISLIPDTEKEYELSKKLSLTASFFALGKILYSFSTPNQIYNTPIGGDK